MADIASVLYIFILAMKSYPAANGALDPMAMLIIPRAMDCARHRSCTFS